MPRRACSADGGGRPHRHADRRQPPHRRSHRPASSASRSRAELLPEDKQRDRRRAAGARGCRSPRSATASTTRRRSPPPMSASPWAAAPTWRWRRRTRRSCTAVSATSPRMIGLSRRTMAQHPPEHHHRARAEGGVPGHHRLSAHRPMAGDPGRHRRDRAGHRQRHAAVALARVRRLLRRRRQRRRRFAARFPDMETASPPRRRPHGDRADQRQAAIAVAGVQHRRAERTPPARYRH